MRKLFFNVGFQFNYGEPFNLRAFYNATYFANPFTNRELDPANENGANNVEDNLDATTMNPEFEQESRGFDGTVEKKGSDLTAAQLYESIENTLFE